MEHFLGYKLDASLIWWLAVVLAFWVGSVSILLVRIWAKLMRLGTQMATLQLYTLATVKLKENNSEKK